MKKNEELETAMKEKNSSKIKHVFDYIPDKAIDIVIQIMLKGLRGVSNG